MGGGQLFRDGKRKKQRGIGAHVESCAKLGFWRSPPPRHISVASWMLQLATTSATSPPHHAVDTSPALLPPPTGMNAAADHSCEGGSRRSYNTYLRISLLLSRSLAVVVANTSRRSFRSFALPVFSPSVFLSAGRCVSGARDTDPFLGCGLDEPHNG
jgi:hypothetical protein